VRGERRYFIHKEATSCLMNDGSTSAPDFSRTQTLNTFFHEIPKNYFNRNFNAYFLTLFKTIVSIREFQIAFFYYFFSAKREKTDCNLN